MKGPNNGGKNYNNLIYADYPALLAGNANELSELTSKINIKKTNGMAVSKKPNSTKVNIVIHCV